MKELLPDQISTWEKFNNNQAFPSWWGAFKNEWRKALDTNVESDNRYLTNVNSHVLHLSIMLTCCVNTLLKCTQIGIQHSLNIQQQTEDMTIRLSSLVKCVHKLILPTGLGPRQVKVCWRKQIFLWMKIIVIA